MDLGFTDFRLRLQNGGLLQVRAEQMELARSRWREIMDLLGEDIPGLTLDDAPRVSREN